MQFARGTVLPVWNSLLIRMLRIGGARPATHDTELLPKVLAVLSRTPLSIYDSALLDFTIRLLKEFLYHFPIALAIARSSVRMFSEVPQNVFDNHRVKWPRAHRRRLPLSGAHRRHSLNRVQENPAQSDDNMSRLEKSIHHGTTDSHSGSVNPFSSRTGLLSVSEVGDIEEIYSMMFNNHSGQISSLEDFINALACLTRFISYNNSPCEAIFICGLLKKIMKSLDYDEIEGSLPNQWINWPIIVTQVVLVRFIVLSSNPISCSKCISHLLLSDSDRDGDERVHIKSSFDFLLDVIKECIITVVQLDEVLQPDGNLGTIEQCIELSCTATLSVIEDVLKLYKMYGTYDILPQLGGMIFMWSLDSSFALVFRRLMENIKRDVFTPRITTDSRVRRFAFELFASLVNVTYATTYMINMSLTWPRGFDGNISAFELIEALSAQIASGRRESFKVLAWHLPKMKWTRKIPIAQGNDFGGSEMQPSITIIELVATIRCVNSVEFLVNVCRYLFSSDLLAEDARHIIMKLIIPTIVFLSKNMPVVEYFVNVGKFSGDFLFVVDLFELLHPLIDIYIAEVMIRYVT
ncbi:hypothetical protein KIN20_030754 [Parelaphostrongylus tenuis]|uniref:Uncharacterized protein n=1 Tax=Parelaphostrongylus tenuis TaxID=148309 RepID=A0AAD5R4L8_PARTN|nr:hypothetical protein KIN20_030754 [Parelaphostrongylus tenuis]